MTTPAPSTPAGVAASDTQKLKRVLSLPDLLIYGMILMQVVAPLPIFGLL